MINIYRNPDADQLKYILSRPSIDTTDIRKKVSAILRDVRENGDAAIKKYNVQFGSSVKDLLVSKDEIDQSENALSSELKTAITMAASNIEKFHAAYQPQENIVETMPGINCWRKAVPIQRVGLYIPGGTAPLFSTMLMLGIPARLAGCKEIITCTPADSNGKVNPAILFAASLSGISKIYKIGGAQAIAAMAFGTETIEAVYKIFGPGNQYVTTAKQLAQLDGVAIDMPAGPSEVCVLADETANAEFIAADLLSQAEHGVDSQVLLVTTDDNLVEKVTDQLSVQLEQLPRKDIAMAALKNSRAIIVKDIASALSVVNEYASEHLIISCKNDKEIADQIVNAGSIFLGDYSPESAGDYASGTNHTLPTGGFAKAYSGVSIESFSKHITYQRLTKQGIQNISNTVERMAGAEGLQAHANAVSIRLK